MRTTRDRVLWSTLAVVAAVAVGVGLAVVLPEGGDGSAVGEIEIVGGPEPPADEPLGRRSTDGETRGPSLSAPDPGRAAASATPGRPTGKPRAGSSATPDRPLDAGGVHDPSTTDPGAASTVDGRTGGGADGASTTDPGGGSGSPPSVTDGDDRVVDPRPQRVTLAGLPGRSSWGAEPVVVTATATSGLDVALSAEGACDLDGRRLRWTGVGGCSVLARQAGDRDWQPATARVTVAVERATPVIDFDDVDVRFERGIRIPLWASAEPPIPLAYTLLDDDPQVFNEDPCGIDAGAFVFADRSAPALAATCAILVEAAAESPYYTTPAPVTAYVTVDFPAWRVDVLDPPARVSHAASGGTVTVSISEQSGAAYGIAVLATGDCRAVGRAADYGDPDEDWVDATPVTRSGSSVLLYAVDVDLDDPSTTAAGTGSCTVTAVAQPEDHEGGVHRDDTSFEIGP